MIDFAEDFDNEPLDEYEMDWVEKVVKRHYKFVGIRRYTGRDTNGQWFKSLHLQVYKWYNKELFIWNIKKGLW